MLENEANIQLEKLGQAIVSIKGVNYAAVVNQDNNINNFHIEIGYDSGTFPSSLLLQYSERKFEHRPIDIKIPKGLPIDYIPKAISYENLNNYLDFPISLREMKSPFSFDKNPYRGIASEGSGSNFGTLGAIVKLKNDNNFYILSNCHVLMNESSKIGHPIKNERKETIATLHWAVSNEYYDIALAKVTDMSLLQKKFKCYDFNKKIAKPIKIGQMVTKCGYTSGSINDGTIVSKNAFVKIGENNKIFKNQILVSKISRGGDSGSTLVDKTGRNSSKDVIGLVFASDKYDFTICNHLHYLFSNEIDCYNYSDDIIMPKINFESFY
ncbi:S1 family peptidase [Flavivirga jejuensis]|uniref:Serine protease n=1 Tax=Flavivirga jejuensis TaxID=870487 RepID=A0ABT8WLF0_9FLAO|nr:serine protease [Flavivirga jejuensis]MDO5973986.1 serine protease [Flavivirga jejuensis]